VQLADGGAPEVMQQLQAEYVQVSEYKLSDQQPLYHDLYELLSALPYEGSQEEHEAKVFLYALDAARDHDECFQADGQLEIQVRGLEDRTYQIEDDYFFVRMLCELHDGLAFENNEVEVET